MSELFTPRKARHGLGRYPEQGELDHRCCGAIIAEITCMGRIDIDRVPDASGLLADRVDEKF